MPVKVRAWEFVFEMVAARKMRTAGFGVQGTRGFGFWRRVPDYALAETPLPNLMLQKNQAGQRGQVSCSIRRDGA